MDTGELMTQEEIHDFGVQTVYNQLKKEGHEMVSANSKLGINPQIVAKKDGRMEFIAVRTACYPNQGELEESVHFQMIEHAKEFNTAPYFASVSIANAEGKTEEEMAVPTRGVGFRVRYEGLLIITDSEHVKILGDDGLKDINP